MEGGAHCAPPPPPVLQSPKKPSTNRVKWYSRVQKSYLRVHLQLYNRNFPIKSVNFIFIYISHALWQHKSCINGIISKYNMKNTNFLNSHWKIGVKLSKYLIFGFFVFTLWSNKAKRSICSRDTTSIHKNNETNDKFYRKVAFLMYTEMVNLTPQSWKAASKLKPHQGLGTRSPSSW